MSISIFGRLLRSNVGRNYVKRYISTIKFAETGEAELPKIPTYDYLDDRIGMFRSMFDSTDARITDNTRLIMVEGNIGCGKSHLASRLADYFGMFHMPDPTEDDIYMFREVEPAFDLRCHNLLLPKSARYYTCEMFWTEPNLKDVGKPLYLQTQFFLRRLLNYTKAKAILMNTGRGVVMDRSPFSEIAFSDALYECGYISERGHRWFNQKHGYACAPLWKPHLIIFIRSSVEQIREHFKKRNIPWEMNGVNLSNKFLETYERTIEKNYLIPMSRYSEVVVVDGTSTDVYNEDDCRIIAKRITEIDLSGDHLLRDDYKFYNWRRSLARLSARLTARNLFSDVGDSYRFLASNFTIPYDIKELCYSDQARELQIAALKLDPRTTYTLQFNPYYEKPLNIMFNPFLLRKNFRTDYPKEYLWH